MDNETIIYQLSVQDIQDVANDTLGRHLSAEEIESILDSIAKRIPWYSAIQDSIYDKINTSGEEKNE